MEKKFKTSTGKDLTLPLRMLTKRELKKIGWEYVPNSIFFNVSKKDGTIPKVDKKVRENMAVIDYPDFSKQPFDENLLQLSIKKQIKSKSDFIILPKFMDETDYDVRRKIAIAGDIKLLGKTDKQIILEISYKCQIQNEELKSVHYNFDILAINYGVYWGQYPTFEKISQRISWMKNLAGKIVFVVGVPLRFVGEDQKDSRLMPCWNLVADGWVKNWRRGSRGDEIKMTDINDLKSKTYQQFLESGYSPQQIIEPCKRTLYEMFQDDMEEARTQYEMDVLDAILSDLRNLTPQTVEGYLYDRFYSKYHAAIIAPYREKVITKHFRENPLFSNLTPEEKELLENAIRVKYTPSATFGLITDLITIINRDQNTPFAELMQVALGFER